MWTRGRLWAALALLLALCGPARGKGSPEKDRERGRGGRGRRTGLGAAGTKGTGGGGSAPPAPPTPAPARSLLPPTHVGSLIPSLPHPPCTGAILVKFRDSISNWDVVRQSGHLQGWDDATPTFLWTGVILDFDMRVRVL